METDKIEQEARKCWEEMGALLDTDGKLATHWQFYLKGFQDAANLYKGTSHIQERLNLQELDKEIDKLLETETPESLKKWLRQYKDNKRDE